MHLTRHLSFGSCQLGFSQRFVGQSVQLVEDKPMTFGDIVLVTTKIDGPYAGFRIVEDGAFGSIDQSVLFTQGNIQQGVHTRSSEDIVKQSQGKPLRVLASVDPVSQENMSLMGMVGTMSFFLYVFGQGQGMLVNCSQRKVGCQPGSHLYYMLEVYIAVDKEGDIGRNVVMGGEALGIMCAVLSRSFFIYKNITSKKVYAENNFFKFIIDEFSG